MKRSGKITCREFRLDTQSNGFEVKNVMLDLGSDINILPKESWEALGQPKLIYFLVKLRMASQYCIYHAERLENMEVNVASVKNVVDFEVIEIIWEKDPYQGKF